MKTILITGANRGLGLGVALQLAKKDFTIILTSRKHKYAKSAADSIIHKSGNKNVYPFELDLNSSRDLYILPQQIMQQFEHIDVLINNAGVLLNDQDCTEVSQDILDKTMAVNFFGPVLLSQKLLPMIKKSNDGRIINVSSGMGSLSESAPGHAAYRMSKSALNGFTAALAADLSQFGIKVVSVCPGWVKTDMGGPNAIRDIETGAFSISQLAWKDGIESGKFYRDGRIINW